MNKNLLYLGLAALGLYLLTKHSAQAGSLTNLCAAGFTPIQGANGATYCIANANTAAESVLIPHGATGTF
jgi:hypothetical protein